MPVKRKVSKKAAPVVAAAATSSPTSFIISSGSDNEAEGPYRISPLPPRVLMDVLRIYSDR